MSVSFSAYILKEICENFRLQCNSFERFSPAAQGDVFRELWKMLRGECICRGSVFRVGFTFFLFFEGSLVELNSILLFYISNQFIEKKKKLLKK